MKYTELGGIVMHAFRRWALLPVLSLLIAAMAAMGMPRADAAPVYNSVPTAAAQLNQQFASPAPVQMRFACALKSDGLMRYVTSPSKCTRFETRVTIVPGPHYACVHRHGLAFLVAALKDCPTPKNRVALRLPPSARPVFFCALRASGLLTYTTQPEECERLRFPVVVPVIHIRHTPPVLAHIESTVLAYSAGAPPVPVTATLTVSSSDATTLDGAKVTISSGFVASTDSLGFANKNGITGSFNATTGVLKLTGKASLATYQAALRSVTFAAKAAAATGSRKVSFQANDGAAHNNLSNVVSRTISVTHPGPPVAVNDTAMTDKHTAIDINVLANDTDPAGKTLTVASVDTTGTKGLVTINPDNTIHYDPNGQFTGLTQGQSATDTFTYMATDGTQTSNSATVTVTITGVNDLPVISNVETTPLSYQAFTPGVAITSTATIADDDDATMAGGGVSITSGFNAAQDTLSFTNQNGITGSYNSSTGMLTLSGNASIADYQLALRSVEFSSSDPSASPAARTISFTVTDSVGAMSAAVTRTISVTEVSPPVAVNDAATTDKHTAIDINVLANDNDPAGKPLTVASVGTTGTKGLVTINPNNTIHYDPNGQFAGLTNGQSATDTFTYQATDGTQTSNSATVTVTITGVNDLPVISIVETTPLSYQAQSPAVMITGTLTIADDDDATMAGGGVSITSGFNATQDTLSFTNQNGITGSYNSSTGVLTLSGNASIANYQAALRSVEFATSDPSGTPAARIISFTVTDSVGAMSMAAQRTIDVTPAPQPPVAVNHTYSAVGNTPLGVGTTPAGPAAKITGSVLDGDSDPNPGATLSVVSNTQPAHGAVSMNPDGTFTYLPNAGFTGTDAFQYTIAGSTAPSLTATATVTINVATLVWYVDDSKTAAGNGEAGTPFNTLSAANAAAGANSIVFLFQGNANYTGGATMQSGEDLFGQPHGLTVGGFNLVAAGGSAPVITNAGGDGIALAAGADVEGVSVTSPTGNGISAVNVTNATVGAANAVAVSGAGGDGIHVSGGNGALNLAGVSVTGSAGHSVSVASRTGGTVTIGGAVTDHGTGISLTGNTGATIAFGGTLTASTGANAAFTATGGGTVTASGTGSTLVTTTGVALNVQNTTIGSGGLMFQSISANGATPGIDLVNTGTSGGVTVTGTGSGGSGGTIQNSTGAGIALTSTTSPSFTDMVIASNKGDGINGSQVNGLTLAGDTVQNNGTQSSVSGENDDGLDFSPNGTGSPDGLTGTVSITNTSVSGSADNNAVISDTSGTLNLTVTGSTFSSDNSTTGNDGLHIDADGSTNATVSVTGSTFSNNFGDHFQFATDPTSTGTNSVTFSNNTLTTTATGVQGGGVVINPFGNSKTTITVDNNNIQKSVFTGIALDENGSAGTLSGAVSGNTIGTAATANSGSAGNDIGIFAEGSGTETLSITNNNLFQYANEAGISFLDREGSPTMKLTITGNTIADPGAFGSWGVLGQAGAATGDAGLVCVAMSGNSIHGSAAAGQGGADFEFDQEFSTTVKLPGYAGGSQNTAAVVAFVQGNNTGNGTPSGIATTSGSGGGFTGGTSC